MHSYLEVKKNVNQCSGCGLCFNRCPQNAIEMKINEEGFFYPRIDKETCTECGLCVTICPFSSNGKDKLETHETKQSYAFKNSEEIRKKSASGGFFTALSDYVLGNSGVIYGAAYDETYRVTHIRAEDKYVRDKMRGSKYIQSEMFSVYDDIAQDVKNGKLVLFSGTPCQCAAISKFFGGKCPDNLYLVDLICHGVLAEKLFKEWLNNIKLRLGLDEEIDVVNLRDKSYGWQSPSVTFKSGYKYYNEYDYFYKIYATHSLQRPSCFNCIYSCRDRVGDFTIGDFWGIKKYYPDLYDEFGVSLVLVNTHRAQNIINYMTNNDKYKLCIISPEEYLEGNPNLSKPTCVGERSEKIKKYYNKYGYDRMTHRFFDITFRRKINSLIMKILNKMHLK